MRNPDFFLSAAGEMRGELAIPRACRSMGRCSDQIRDDYMIIEVAPPVEGLNDGVEGINELVIAARQSGFSLFPIREWPCHVYICRILDTSLFRTAAFTSDQVALIGWGTIFRTLDEANEFYRRFESEVS